MGLFDKLFGARPAKEKPSKTKPEPLSSPVNKSCGITAKSCSTSAPPVEKKDAP